ncbi:MAG: homocysteine S-methyltransferase family protein [Anaerolineaceae bacterium]|nr:homocysteine S-methyltransferase family protein [Anaerolineaceae bacterium]
MTKYRSNLPQLKGDLFLTDGGIETTLIFHDGFELPEFAAFTLLQQEEGELALRRYFKTYAAIAQAHEVGFILEAPTWRSSPDWGAKLGYSAEALVRVNWQAIALLEDIRREFETDASPMVISGCVGPRGDGYVIDALMTPDEAQQYHAVQINTFRITQADMITAITMTYVAEAIGVAQAAKAAGLPVVISFTVETDGRLPSGQTLPQAIKQVDDATDNYPAYYMINCAHPDHFQDALTAGESWTARIGGLRANASRRSHAELDEAEELDAGNPVELGHHYDALRRQLVNFNVMGGCCGTDHRHVLAMVQACKPQSTFA